MKQNTKRLYSMIFALVFIVLALVAYFDLLAPAYGDLQASKGNEISQQGLLANEKQIVSEMKGLLSTYESQTSQEQAINTALPVGPNLASALAQLYGIAGASDVALQNVGIASQISNASTPSASGQGGLAGVASQGQVVQPIGTLSFTLAVVGSYENFQTFIQTLETNMRFFDIEQISLQPVQTGSGKGSTTGDLFTFSLTVQTYYQAP